MSHHPLSNLLVARLREFFREPEAVFWVYGFPVLLAILLGIAFRDRPPEQVRVDIEQAHSGDVLEVDPQLASALAAENGFVPVVCLPDDCAARLRMGKTDIVIVSGSPYEFRFDPTRPESVLARARVDDALQRAAGRKDVVLTADKLVTQPGSRYIDFLIPGLLGMNLMGGGLWGVGFVTVDMRVKKLLKRLIATPMKKSHFLMALMGSRLLFMLPEVALLLAAGVILFGVAIKGSIVSILLVCVLGALSFAGLGLLVASRAQKIETVSGLMNLVMLPMWLLSGIFFSSDRFPDGVQPFIKALPLTMLNDSLRAVILEGSSLPVLWLPLLGMALWGSISFALALKWFRWN